MKLDDLYFDVIFRDETDKDLKKIENKLKGMSANIKVSIDEKSLNKALSEASLSKDATIKIGNVRLSAKTLSDAIKSANSSNNTTLILDKIKLSSSAIRSIQKDLDDIEFKIKKVRVDTSELEKKIADAVSRGMSRGSSGSGGNNGGGDAAEKATTSLGNAINKLKAVFVSGVIGKFIADLTQSIGMFEQQLVALQSMLMSYSRGTNLFNQIKDFSIKSPFRFSELVGFTKQLTAFQVPYEEIFDTTKRLADLSAGLGVDMSRIILAYGQVRSAEYLRGQELRQFTEAGVPLLQLLADKFSLLEKRAVSVGDVFDYVSKRKVPFAMVKDVLQDLTNEGGMFYNMQEKQADTLAGKVKNLADAYDVLKYQIGQSGAKGLLSGFMSLLFNIMKCKDAIVAFGAAMTVAFAVAGIKMMIASFAKFKAQLASAAAMAGGWTSVISGAIAGIAMAIWNAHQQTEEAKENLKQATAEIKKNVQDMSDVFGNIELNISVRGEDKLEAIQKMVEKIKDIMPNGEANSLIANLLGGDDLDKSYKKIKDTVSELDKVQLIINELSEAGVTANGRSWANIFVKDLPNTLEEFTELQKKIKDLKPSEMIFNKDVADWYGAKTRLNNNLELYVDNIKEVLQNKFKGMKLSPEVINTAISSYVDSDQLFKGDKRIPKIYAQLELTNTNDALKKSSELTNVYLESVDKYAKKIGVDMVELLNEYQLTGQDKASEVYKKLTEIFKYASEEAKKSVGEFSNEFDEVARRITSNPLDINLRLHFGNVEQLGEMQKVLMRAYYDMTHGKGMYDRNLSVTPINDISRIFKEPFWQYIGPQVGSTASLTDVKSVLQKDYKNQQEELKNLNLSLAKNRDDNILKESKAATEERIKFLKTAFKAFNIAPEDSKNGSSSRNREDALLKTERERYDLLKKYIQEYERLVKLYGKEKAAKEVAKEIDFSKILNDKRFMAAMGGKIDASNPVKLYQKYLQYLKTSLSGSGDRNKFVEDVRIAGAKVQRDKEAKDLSDSYDLLNKEIEKNTKQWDVYTKMLNITGSENAAKAFAFGSVIPFSKQSEQLKDTLSTNFKDILKMPIESYANMGENEMIQNLGEGPAKLLQKYFKMSESEQSKALDNLLAGLEKSMDLDATLRSIDNKFDKLVDSARDNGFGQEEIDKLNKQRDEERAKTQWDFFKKTPQYAQMFDDLDRISTQSLNDLYDTFLNMKPEVQEDAASLKELMSALKKIREEVEQRNPFKTILNSIKDANLVRGLKFTNGVHTITDDRVGKIFGKKVGESITKEEADNKGLSLTKSLSNGIGGVINGFKALEDILNPVSKLFEQLGNDSIAEAFKTVTDALSAADTTQKGMNSAATLFEGMGASGVSSAISAASPYVSAAMAGVSVVTSILALHDKALQKHIEMLKREEKKAKAIYDLIEQRLKYTLGKGYGMDTLKGFTEGTTYRSQRENLMTQYYLKQQQLADELDKKKKDKDTIADLQSDIETMKETILQYSEELASDLFSLNLQDWAKSIGDSLIDAFAEGTSAADAFNDSVADIIKNVVKNMAQLYIIEPAMKDLQNYLFGSDGMGGVFGKDLTFSKEDLMGMIPILANLKTSIGNVKDLYDAIKEVASQNGIDLSGTSSGLTAGIQSVTEDTADLLASYINAIRARLMLQGALLDEKMPLLQEINEAQLRELQNITINTMRNAEAAERIEDAITSLTTIGSNGKQLKVKAY